MLKFLTHKKFWLPPLILLALIVITEAMLRAGWYDPWLKPRSFLGNAKYRLDAIDAIGKDNIHWITVGDSRIDWAVDHRKLAEVQSAKGIKHVRMSFESSHFPAIQATIDWSTEHMPNLNGVMLGTTETSLAQYVNMDKQYKVGWPFRYHFDFKQYTSTTSDHPIKELIRKSAWYNYFADFRAFLTNPLKRLKQLNLHQVRDSALMFRREDSGNLCAHPLETLEQCVNSLKTVDISKRENKGFKAILNVCGTPRAKARLLSKEPVSDQGNALVMIDNWVQLVRNVLAQRKHFTLVLLPEHETHQYVIKPANAGLITQRILAQVKQNRHFRLIDLRNVFAGERQCEMYADPNHFSNAGIEKITQALLKQL